MSNVLQTLFNTNHELPDLQVIVILAILAIVAPSVAKYLQRQHQDLCRLGKAPCSAQEKALSG